MVLWGAVGLNQQLARKWSLLAYVGGSRDSNPNNGSFLHRQAILVVGQETSFQFNHHWQLALGTSLRYQNFYEGNFPYDEDDPGVRTEIRHYLRLFYRYQINKISFTYSFRPEYRMYYDPDWNRWTPTPLELRFRLKGQASIPLNESKSTQLVLANELLSITDHKVLANENYWSTFQLSEDRFTSYIRHTFKKPSLIFDVGYMNQIILTTSKPYYIGHVAFDFIFVNPFGKPAHSN